MLKLYNNIKQRRKELNISQEKLAKMVGYNDRSAITKIEKGEVDLPQSKIILFAKALNTTPGQLMGWEEPDESNLTNDETSLLSDYRLLDQEDKATIRGEVKGLLLSEKYKKATQNGTA